MIQQRGLVLPVYALAPCWDERQPHYALFVERGAWDNEAPNLLAAIDSALGHANEEYRSKRASKRLGPLQFRWLEPGTWATWDRERLERTGAAPEQYKHPCLIGDLQFHKKMLVSPPVE